MQRILRPLLLLATLACALAVTACGGDDAASQDVDSLLKETFANSQDIKSGRIELEAKVEISGAAAGQLQGPVSVKLGGPFQSEGEGKVPKFDFDASLQGGGQSFKGGIASTGDKAFVNLNGQEYAVGDELFNQYQKAYAEQSKKSGENKQSLASLGLNPRKWLTGAKNEGEAKVGDTDVVKITGKVDVAKLVEDLNSIAGQLGQGQLDERLTDKQREEIQKAVKDVSVEIYTGADDKIMRRMVVALGVDAQGQGSGNIRLDYSILELNEDQEVKAPANAKPFDELVNQLGGLGGLLGGGGGSGSGGSGSGGSAPSNDQLEKYTQCVEDAGNDQAKAQKCADLITP